MRCRVPETRRVRVPQMKGFARWGPAVGGSGTTGVRVPRGVAHMAAWGGAVDCSCEDLGASNSVVDVCPKNLVKARASNELWRIILEGFKPYNPDKLTRREAVDSQLNNTALHMIQTSVGTQELPRVRNYTTAKEAWDGLAASCIGSESTRRNKYNALRNQAEGFMRLPDEDHQVMYGRLLIVADAFRLSGATHINDSWIKEKYIECMMPFVPIDVKTLVGRECYSSLSSQDAVHEMQALKVLEQNSHDSRNRAIGMAKGNNLALVVNPVEEVYPQEQYRASWSMSYPEDLECHYHDHMAFHAKSFWVDPSKAKEDNIKRNHKSGFTSFGPKTRSCYNCDDKRHFIAECPYENRELHNGRLIPKDKSKESKGKYSKAPNKKFYNNKSKKGKRPPRVVLVTREEYSSDEVVSSSDDEGESSKEVAAIVTTNIPSSSLFESPNENPHIKNAHCFMATSSLDTSIVLSTQEEYSSGDDDVDDEEDATSNGLVALASLSTNSSSPSESPNEIIHVEEESCLMAKSSEVSSPSPSMPNISSDLGVDDASLKVKQEMLEFDEKNKQGHLLSGRQWAIADCKSVEGRGAVGTIASNELWRIILEGFKPYNPDKLTRREAVDSQLNNTALHMIQTSVGTQELPRVRNYTTAKEAWDGLAASCIGSDSTRRNKYNALRNQAEGFMRLPDEDHQVMYGRLLIVADAFRLSGATHINDSWIKEKYIECMMPFVPIDVKTLVGRECYSSLSSQDAVHEMQALKVLEQNSHDSRNRAIGMAKGNNLALVVNPVEEVYPQEQYRASWSMSYPEDLECHYHDHMAFHAKSFWVDPSKAKEDNIKRNHKSGFTSFGPKTRSCYNCDDKRHFIAECPYENRELHNGRLIPKDKSKESNGKYSKAPDTSPTNPSKEIFSELDETFAQGPIFARSFQKTEDLTNWGHEAPEEAAGPALAAPTCPWALVWPRVDPPPKGRRETPREPRYGKPYRDAAAANPISGIWRSPPAPCRRGDSSPGGLYTAMVSGVMSE
ncbi:hypothetical protein QYE76_041546 [Lolium multiflorum]|uniref:CCHC-type domain-containing protein n=1 Tax=Lolium multiflorum TaxID=4521 RepID=A0AAD8TEZ3_LOLMU|nr:hypothetical protein QYE76_041546 [Lolium multiflorum]